MNDSLQQRQLDAEVQAVELGVDAYYEELAGRVAAGKQFDGGVGADLLGRALGPLIKAFEAERTWAMQEHLESVQKRGRPHANDMDWLMLQVPEETAYIALKAMLITAATDGSKMASVSAVGKALEMQSVIGAMHKKDEWKGKLRGIERAYKQGVTAKVLRRNMKKFEGIGEVRWSNEDIMRVGLHATHVTLEALPWMFAVNTVYAKSKGIQRVDLTDEVVEEIDKNHAARANLSPLKFPMVCPPQEYDAEGNGGGYLALPTPLLKVKHDGNHTALGGEVSPAILCAIEALNNTPYRINKRVLEAATRAVEQGSHEVLPVAGDLPMPDPVDTEVWENMTPEEKQEVKQKRRLAHDHNNRTRSKRMTMYAQVNTAEMFKGEPSIYFPHTMDFRGRVYPEPQLLNPQVDDFGKGMLEFGEGVALGEDGYDWLCYQVAQTYGLDKLDREGQKGWVMNWAGALHRIADHPFSEREYAFWCKAEKPWQFLAAVFEWSAVSRMAADVDMKFIKSRLICNVDGSCNGLQHLSALGRDPKGGAAVNLMPGKRHDVYTAVAERVAKVVGLEMEEYNLAAEIHAKDLVTRKLVKRAVMTTPYGVTPHGIRSQLINDGHLNEISRELRGEAAVYLTNLIQEAIDDTLVVGRQIMQWLQDCASIAAEGGKGLTWQTPVELEVKQEYLDMRVKKIRTVLGTGKVPWTYIHHKTDNMASSKQANSIAPNLVHSFDAAHLMKTVVLAYEEGIDAFSMVHDSFGTHAGSMTRLNRVLRRTFVKMYNSTNWLQALHSEFEECTGMELPAPPERGDLDMLEVLNSEWFFA